MARFGFPFLGRARRLLLRRSLRLLGEVWRFRPRQLVLVATLATLAAAAEGAGILLLLPLLNLLGSSGAAPPPGRLEMALVLYVLLVIGAALVVAQRQVAAARLNLEFIDHLRQRLHTAVLRMDWRAFSRLRASDLSHGLTHDVDLTQSAVEFMLNLGGLAIQVIVALAVVVTLSPSLAGLAVLSGLVLIPVTGKLNRRLYRLGQQAGLAWQRLMAELANDLAGFRLVKAFELAPARSRRFADALADVREQDLAVRRALSRNSLIVRVLGAVAAALVLVFAVRGLGLPPARILAMMVALTRLLQVGSRLMDGWRHVVHALPAHARALRLLARCRRAAEFEAAPGADDISTIGETIAEIALDRVSVRYAADRAPALADLTLTLPGGRMTVIVGPSGAGKSTLGDLLLGLIGPDAGEIRVDGQVLLPGNRLAWRRRTSLLPQDPLLFNGTVRANLLLARPDATEAELRDALTAAGAEAFVAALPLGLDTGIGDHGIAVSGGERQRLALARALLRRPALLVLDEPTSALDPDSEARILAALRELRGQVTIVLITHRPSAIAYADLVVRLEGGRSVPPA